LDYQDIKLKIVEMEGYDAHDFNLFDDRASLLWRKPYVDGAVRELTSGDNRSAEQLRQAVEQMMLANRERNGSATVISHASHRGGGTVRFDVETDDTQAMIRDMRRNPASG
jgi:hypothetical protein